MPSKSPMAFGDELASKPKSKRLPPKQIEYIPQATSPKDWTRKDRNRVSSAVAMGVFGGLFIWSIFAFLIFFFFLVPVV